MQVIFFSQAQAVCNEAGDLAKLFSFLDQFRQIGAQGGFAAGEDDVRNASVPGFFQDLLPFLTVQVAFDAVHRSKGDAVVIGRLVGEGTIQP
ncbi:hypothetical protein SDC9_190387 [bioreactor metagenome]|uniref:Uncharacterized protein n=1 Tax=bioreactor metagenome TaxID=1076179 RepID=A0A645HXA6_9ZZZZ